MIEPARNHLVGFLLNALDHAETAQVERALATEDGLRDDLQRLRGHLPALEKDREHFEPPPGLAARTCNWLAHQLQELHSSSPDQLGGLAFFAAPLDAPPEAAPLANLAAVPDDSPVSGPSVSYPSEPSPSVTPASLSADCRKWAGAAGASAGAASAGAAWGGWRMRVADVVVALGIVCCASFLFIPALAHCRFASRTQACQNNLRQIGAALTAYSGVHGGAFPHVPLRGNRAFAGVIGVVLRDSEFLANPAALFCVSAQRRENASAMPFPTLAQVDLAPAQLLPAIRQAARGDYGFTVGYWERGTLAFLRNQRRPWYAIAADAPSDSLPSHATANHAGKGQSVLFEDGHYQFLRRCCPRLSRDELFLNHFGHVSPGVDANDAVILAGDVALDGLQPES
jgi:hypothetical protein